MGRFSSIRLKDPQPPSFMVHLPGFLEVLDPFSWVVGSQVFCPFSTSLGGWWDTCALVLCVLGHAPLSYLNSNLALPHIPRILGFWESLGILVQFLSSSPAIFSLKDWAELLLLLFSSLFHEAQSLPIHGLGPLPIDF